MNNNLDFQFGMYEPATDSVIINTDENAILVIRCKECNVIPLLSLMTRMILYICIAWQRNRLCHMPNWH